LTSFGLIKVVDSPNACNIVKIDISKTDIDDSGIIAIANS
jgi:hypothetical protein